MHGICIETTNIKDWCHPTRQSQTPPCDFWNTKHDSSFRAQPAASEPQEAPVRVPANAPSEGGIGRLGWLSIFRPEAEVGGLRKRRDGSGTCMIRTPLQRTTWNPPKPRRVGLRKMVKATGPFSGSMVVNRESTHQPTPRRPRSIHLCKALQPFLFYDRRTDSPSFLSPPLALYMECVYNNYKSVKHQRDTSQIASG